MARFARRAESEPLMRLERPSSASAQTTAHVINACFNELLRQSPLESRDIHNLSVSKRGEHDYHDNFVDELKKISDEYKQRLDVLASLERHVVQAKARALAAEEKTLSTLREGCPGYEDIGLPEGPSQLRKHLDEELLARHNLLTLSQCLPPSSEPSQPPQVAAPSYVHPTFTSTQHAKVPAGLVPSTTRTIQSTRPVWQETISPLEREAEKNALAKLEGRADYLKNPRFSNTVLTNTASSGPLKKQQQQQQLDSCPQLFVAEPREIVFTSYQIGESYTATLELKNVSGASRQLRVVPLNSSHFSISPGQFPSADGLIAPGMHCTYTVTFSPDSLANYQDELRVLSYCGHCLSVPLKGMRPAPELTLPSTLDCGYCLAGSTKVIVLECANTGGEGNFRLMTVDGSDEHQELQHSLVLEVDHFSITPSEFYLPPGGRVEFTVVFTPPVVGNYSRQFHMACDNGQMITFTLQGIAEQVSVGCVFIGPSSSSEIASFKISACYFLKDREDPTISGIDTDYNYCGECEDVLESPTVKFDHVNPHNAAYRTVVVRNFCNVDLSYCWRFYRPVTEPHDTTGLPGTSLRHEDDPVANGLIESVHTSFSVRPSSGMLCAKEVKSFVFQFLPEKVGSFSDMAHLVLLGVPSPSLNLDSEGESWVQLSNNEASTGCVELLAVAEPYSIELQPPALLLPGELPIAAGTRKRLKMLNHSLCVVHYYWSGSDSAGGITVDPPSGSIVSGGCAFCEVVVSGRREGPFSTQLQCSIEHSDTPLQLPLQGYVQGPVLDIASASLNFGLVSRGNLSTLQLPLKNESNCSVLFELRQVVAKVDEKEEKKEEEEKEEVEEKGEVEKEEEKKDGRGGSFVDYLCLSFSPGSGELGPHGSTVVCVECRPVRCGRLRSLVECRVNGKPIRHIEVRAEIQSPQVCLENCQLHVERAFVGVEEKKTVRLRNNGLIPSQFAWSSQLQGSSSAHCKVDVRPMTGRIAPRETVTVTLATTWNEVGSHPEVVLECMVLGMQSPLFLLLSAEVQGLSVSYHLPSSAVEHTSSPHASLEELLLDFGGTNLLGSSRVLSLVVTNMSAIPASLSAHVRHFPMAKPPTPPTHPKPCELAGGKAVASRGRYLLGRTDNIGNPRSRTDQQAIADYSSAILRDDRGACFVVDPPSTPLHPFTSHTLTVTAYSDMWGEYEDELICEVPGLDPRVIPIHYKATGCPIVFQTTASSAHTFVRFGSHPPNAKPVKRPLKLRNTSSSAIRISWQTFNILSQDETLLDLFTYIGDPFPRQTSSTTSLSAKHTSTYSLEAPPPPSSNAVSATCTSEVDVLELEGSSEEFDEGCDGEGLSLFRVSLKAHEGVASSEPFDVHPKQMVIPAHGQGVVYVSFLPSSSSSSSSPALRDSLETLASYALGYFSLDEQHPPHVTRAAGYDMEPLRIDMVADIEHARLSLEGDEDEDLHFSYPASILLRGTEVQERATRTHHFALINHTASTLEFKLRISSSSSSSSHFMLTAPSPDSCIRLKPQKSTSVSVALSFSLDDIRCVGSTEKNASFADELQIEFSTGVKQVFPLTASIALPSLTLSEKQAVFGTCLLGETCTSAVVLSNNTLSDALWQTEISPDLNEVVSLSPSRGVLPAHLSRGACSTELLQITFCPKHECEYEGVAQLVEILTGAVKFLTINGSGSPDEQFSHT